MVDTVPALIRAAAQHCYSMYVMQPDLQSISRRSCLAILLTVLSGWVGKCRFQSAPQSCNCFMLLNAPLWPCRSGYRRRREAKICRSLLQKLKDEQATAVRNQQYPATSCPICFEDLAKPDAAPNSPSASGAGMAGVYKGDQSSSGFGASSSSKSDVAPSAPPLETPSEYESLLGKDRERPGLHEDEHTHIRWVLRQTFVLLCGCFATEHSLPSCCTNACMITGFPFHCRNRF